MTSQPAIQDTYPDDVAHCYGCGRLNEHGYQIKTRLHGEGTLTEFMPEPFHTAIPGFIYGGLIASLIDCHSTGSAAIFAMQEAGVEIGSLPSPRFLTAHLEVDYLEPTPLDRVTLIGKAVEVKGRKVVVVTEFIASGEVTARGYAVLVKMSDGMIEALSV
ncbi:MAG: PaaI family thioesterase [Acidimicrobiia bacterium]